MSSGSAVSVTTNLCRVWAKCRQDQVTSSWFSDLAVFHFTKCDHHLLFTDNFSEYFPVITVCTAWALCWHMYHIGGSISHWLSTCGCHWSRPRPAPAWAGGAHLAPGLDSCTPGTQQVATDWSACHTVTGRCSGRCSSCTDGALYRTQESGDTFQFTAYNTKSYWG